MEKCRVRVFYSGRVQGVGFRYQARALVRGFDVTGTVRNLLDGRVELVADGTREELEAFLQAIRESGVGPLIKREQIGWEPVEGMFRGFEILR